MPIPDFTDLLYKTRHRARSLERWQAELELESGLPANEYLWRTLEQINVWPLYDATDVSGTEDEDYAAGLPPFTRGPYPTMYAVRPWTIRQYAGYSTAEESNAFYRRNLAAGQRGSLPRLSRWRRRAWLAHGTHRP